MPLLPWSPPPRLPRRRSSVLGALAVVAAACVLVPAAPADANGRFPAAGQIAIHPGDPSQILVRATFGLLLTQDGGASWRWICEGAVGFGDFEDPMIAITQGGTVLAGLFGGLATSVDGCGWARDEAIGDRSVVDLSTEVEDRSRAVLVTSNYVSGGTFRAQLWESVDDGLSWAQAGADLRDDILALNLDAAPSEPERVYVTGRLWPKPYSGMLQRTDDRGLTWEALPIPGSDDRNLPYLSAIDPAFPERLYVRLDGEPSDTLLVSSDGGNDWEVAFEATGNLLGFALSPDGATVLVGGEKDGLWRAPAATLAFEKVADVPIRCLTWHESGVYACSADAAGGFTVGRSLDEGESFAPLMRLGAVCAPLDCPASTEAGSICPKEWPVTAAVLRPDPCETGSGASGSGGSEPTDGGDSFGGCACSTSAQTGAAGGLLSAMAALGLARRRRMRQAPPESTTKGAPAR